MDITTKVNGNTLSAAEFNEITTELQDNLIDKSGQAATDGSLDQVGIAVASIAAQGGVFATDSGTANTYVLTQVSPFPAPHSFKNGLTIRFRAGNANTGASTVNPFGLGVKNIKQADGTTNLASGMITTSTDVVIRYNSALEVFILGGTASQYDVGTSGSTIPLNSSLGSAAYLTAGSVAGNLPIIGTTGYLLKSVNVYTSSGTWTKGSNTNAIYVVCIGGGGGGNLQGGGGGGGTAMGFMTSGFGSSQTVTIGAGGAAGNSGGTSSLGTLFNSTGGSTGVLADSSAAGTTYIGGQGGIGSGSGSQLNISGGAGGAGASLSVAGNLMRFAGSGGNSLYGGGGSGAGNPGRGNGAGGGGNWNGAAGAGSSGVVIVYEYV